MKVGQCWRACWRTYGTGALGFGFVVGFTVLLTLAENKIRAVPEGFSAARPRADAAQTAATARRAIPRRSLAQAGRSAGSDRQTRTELAAASLRLPLVFESNQGQTGRRVKFLARGQGYTLFLTPNEAVFSFQKGRKSREGISEEARETDAQTVLRMKLVGANPLPVVSGAEPLASKSNYFIGRDPRKWRGNVAHYAKVRYGQVYPGVDLVYYGDQRRLEYDFVVAPGASPQAITLDFRGAQETRIDARGDVVLQIEGGELRLHNPQVCQMAGESKRIVPARYVLKGKGQVGFEVAAHDQTRSLIIDPVLSYSTYLGGGSEDIANAVAVDASGNVYVTGSTGSINFPTEAPFQDGNKGAPDAFVAKLKPDGSGLVYSTYLGGTGYDRGTDIVVDGSGNAYIAGYTSSTAFPTTPGVVQGNNGGDVDAFVAKLNPSGSSLAYSTYLGGAGADRGRAIAIDISGNAYVTGETQSTNFPTASALQSTNAGGSDAFVTKLNASGSSRVYSTYLGGSYADYAQGIALDASSNAYVTGYTFSTNFPTSSPMHPMQAANAGATDVFVAKLQANGSGLAYSTYLGGSGFDEGLSIAVDTGGNAYLTGETDSTDFPTTQGALQTASPGNGDAFVAKLNGSGSAFAYSTYLGGIDAERGNAIVVDSSGNAFVTGYTQSSDFPTEKALQGTFGGGTCGLNPCSDAFATELSADGSALVYSTFLGGSGADEGMAIALDSSDNAYVAGRASSSNFPATPGAFQAAYAGGGSNGDAFVAKISPNDGPGMALSPQSLTFSDQVTGTSSAPKTVSLRNYGSAALTITSIETSGDFAQTNDCGSSLAEGGSACTISVTSSPTEVGDRTGALTISSDASGSPHTVALAGKGVAPGPVVSLSPSSLTFADQTFETTSGPQTVTLTNTGTAPLAITKIETTGDFAQTNSCPASLAPAESCEISVTFTPKATGERTGFLKVTDDAPGSPQNVSLSGTGLAVFSMSADPTSVTLTRSTSSTTFTISASAPESFTGSITLGCTGVSPASCSFNPTAIKAGETSTLTVSNIASITADSLTFSATGTSGEQSVTLSLALVLGNFSISASPPLVTIAAGETATYSLTITPVNSFNGEVSLSCGGAPKEATCTVTPKSVTPDGTNPVTATVEVKTTARSGAGPRSHPGGRTAPPGWRGGGLFLWLPWGVALTMLVGLALVGRRYRRARAFRWAPLAAILLFVLLWVACDSYYYNPYGGPVQPPGTPPGNSTILILGTATGLAHNTSVNLSVT